MRLNPDCVRDILFTVEENTGHGIYMNYPSEEDGAYTRLNSYSEDEVMYHINQCELSGLITKVDWFMGDSCLIYDLAPQGHEFLANIRSDTNWSKTKETASKVGSFSLNVLSQIAVNVVNSLINKHI